MRKEAVLFLCVLFFSAYPAMVHADESGLSLTSPDFVQHGPIPAKYTCDGNDINPALIVKHVPARAKSLVLIVEDPDAPVGVWTHWLLWNIRPTVETIKENSSPAGAVQGINDFKKHAYGGPCPPWGTHRYFFKLFALDTVLAVSHDSKKTDIEDAMKGHILSQSLLTGLYKRK
jgi:Raf kinase inhibitor-like YbhB/YbcL family protein